jgi:hypothetical protein
MDNAPTGSRRTPGSGNVATPARLAAIENRLDEIIRRLDELKKLLTMLELCTAKPSAHCRGLADPKADRLSP